MKSRAKQYVDIVNAALMESGTDFIEVHGICFDENDEVIDHEDGDYCPPLFTVTTLGHVTAAQQAALDKAMSLAYAHVFAKDPA